MYRTVLGKIESARNQWDTVIDEGSARKGAKNAFRETWLSRQPDSRPEAGTSPRPDSDDFLFFVQQKKRLPCLMLWQGAQLTCRLAGLPCKSEHQNMENVLLDSRALRSSFLVPTSHRRDDGQRRRTKHVDGPTQQGQTAIRRFRQTPRGENEGRHMERERERESKRET